MIRAFREEDLSAVMDIWLNANIQAHDFIPKEYWESHFDMVKDMLPQAEVYVFEGGQPGQIIGFIGLMDTYIAGLFVEKQARSQGVGKQLIDFVKSFKDELSLHVYEKNERATSFYLREGFTIPSRSTDEDTGEKELLMVWEHAASQHKSR